MRVSMGPIMYGLSTLDVPDIDEGQNGYIYRPKQFITDNKKTFGRGYSARNEAREVMRHWFAREMQKRDWAMPSKIGRPDRSAFPSVGQGTSLEVHYTHPVWGHVALSAVMLFRRSRHELPSLGISAGGHPMVSMLLTKRVDGNQMFGYKNSERLLDATVKMERQDIGELREALREWAQDPFEGTIKQFFPGSRDRARELLWDPILEQVDFFEGFDSDGYEDLAFDDAGNSTLRVVSSKGAYVALGENADTITQLATIEAKKLVNLFNVNDATFRMQEKYLNYEPTITGFQITIPARENVSGREHDHTVHVNAQRAWVECGYLKDESRRLDHERRKAQNALIDMMKEVNNDQMGDK